MNKIEAKARDVIRYVREATTARTPDHEIERRVIDVLWGVFHNMGYVEPDEAAQEAPGEVPEFFPKCYGTAKVETKKGITFVNCLMCSLEDRCRKENEERKAHEEHVMYHYGETRLEEDEEETEDEEE